MANQISGLTTINTVVSAVLMDLGQEEKYDAMAEKIAQYAIWQYSELFQGFAPNNIKVLYCTLNNYRTMDLPDDFMDYLKIGIICNGRVWTLTLNENLALPRANECGLELRDVINDTVDPHVANGWGGYYYADHFKHGNYVGGLFGMTGGFNKGYYRMDYDRHQIVFDMGIPQGTEAVLEYKSTGVNVSGATYIHRNFLNPLVKYCLWRVKRYRDDVPANEKQMLAQDYNDAIRDLSINQIPFDLTEMLDAMRANTSMLPKR